MFWENEETGRADAQDDQGASEEHGGEGLSGRERSVLILVAWGYTNKEVGIKLHLSAKTVETYRLRLTRKLGFKSRVDMVAWAKERGFLERRP